MVSSDAATLALDAARPTAIPSATPSPSWPPVRATRGEQKDAGPYAMFEPTIDDSPPCAAKLPPSAPFELRVTPGQREGRSVLRVSLKNCSTSPRSVHHDVRMSRVSLTVAARDGGALPIDDLHMLEKFDNATYCVDVQRLAPDEERWLVDADVNRVDGLAIGVAGQSVRVAPSEPIVVQISFRSWASRCVDEGRARAIPDVWLGTVTAPPLTVR